MARAAASAGSRSAWPRALQTDSWRAARPARAEPALHRDAPAGSVHGARHRRRRLLDLMIHDLDVILSLVPSRISSIRLGRSARPDRQVDIRERPHPLRERLRRQCDGQPDQAHGAGCATAGVRVDSYLSLDYGPQEAVIYTLRRSDHAPAGDVASRVWRKRGGAPGRAARLPAARARRGGLRGDGGGGTAALRDGAPRRGTDRLVSRLRKGGGRPMAAKPASRNPPGRTSTAATSGRSYLVAETAGSSPTPLGSP